MATYAPTAVGVKAPAGGFQQGGWYGGRQYWDGTLSEPNQIHPSSNQVGAGQAVSQEVVAQSAQAQGKTPEQLNAYFESQKTQAAQAKPATAVPAPNYSNAGTTGASGAGGIGMTQAPELNLPELYKTLYASSGISDIEKQYSDQEKSYIEAKGKINDNPFLSEATRVGRVAKLESLFNERTGNLKNDIATKKADIETQLNLQTKQFDINSTSAQQALSRLNTLLSMGALNGATGEDIAQITRSTGISSSAIQAAINASNKKDVKTEIIKSEADDGTVTATVINSETGEVIATNNLGRIGNAEKGASAPKATEGDSQQAVGNIISSYISSEAYQAQISPEDLYRQLLLKYPLAASYIKDNWTADDIRSATR